MKVSDDKISESPGMSRFAGKVSLSVSKPFAEHVRLPGLSRPTLELSLLVGCQGLTQGCGGPACYYFAFQSVRMCSEDADIHDALQLYTQNPHSKTVRYMMYLDRVSILEALLSEEKILVCTWGPSGGVCFSKEGPRFQEPRCRRSQSHNTS